MDIKRKLSNIPMYKCKLNVEVIIAISSCSFNDMQARIMIYLENTRLFNEQRELWSWMIHISSKKNSFIF